MKLFFYRKFGKALPFPIILYLEVTKKCNLKCKFCDIWLIQRKNRDLLRNELSTQEIISLIKESKRIGVKLIHFDGGEPLMRNDILKLLNTARKSNMVVSIVTNATILSKIEKMTKNVNIVHISLDSINASHHDNWRGKKGTYRKVLKAIEIIKRTDPNLPIFLNTLVHSKNYKELISIAEFAKKCGLTGIRFLPIHRELPVNVYSIQDETFFFKNNSQIEQLKKELKKLRNRLSNLDLISNSSFLFHIPTFYCKKYFKFTCYAGYLFCKIDSLGNLYFCSLGNSCGNIRNESLFKIWTSENANKERKRVDKCAGCSISCYVEPSLRFSLKYQLSNFRESLKELKAFHFI